jgi:hypothetical protein
VESERYSESGLLRLGQHAVAIQQGRTRLVQPGERKLRFGLDAATP